jgi:hypothetical protein
MNEKYLTTFLIGFSLMFTLHYLLEPTWSINEPRPRSIRMVVNYAIGTIGIFLSFLYLHPELWLDVTVSISGAAIATIVAHGRDWLLQLMKRDQANGLIEESETEA